MGLAGRLLWPFLGVDSEAPVRSLVSLTFCLLLVAGCGPAIPREDLGTVVDEVPEVPGTEEPYEMPALEGPAAEAAPIERPKNPGETPR